MLRRRNMPFGRVIAIGALLLIVAAARPAGADSAYFNFDDVTPVPYPPVYTQGSITAAFSGQIAFAPQFRLTVLNVCLFCGSINFNRPMTGVSLTFVSTVGQFGQPDTFRADAFLGPNLVGSVSKVGTFDHGPFIPPGSWPEGQISYNGPAFDNIRFTNVVAIDNISVTAGSTTATAAPEPSALALALLPGGAGISAYARRLRRRSA